MAVCVLLMGSIFFGRRYNPFCSIRSALSPSLAARLLSCCSTALLHTHTHTCACARMFGARHCACVLSLTSRHVSTHVAWGTTIQPQPPRYHRWCFAAQLVNSVRTSLFMDTGCFAVHSIRCTQGTTSWFVCCIQVMLRSRMLSHAPVPVRFREILSQPNTDTRHTSCTQPCAPSACCQLRHLLIAL